MRRTWLNRVCVLQGDGVFLHAGRPTEWQTRRPGIDVLTMH